LSRSDPAASSTQGFGCGLRKLPFMVHLGGVSAIDGTDRLIGFSQSMADFFHNIQFANLPCRRKAKMSALSKVEMSVSAPFWELGGCHFDGHGGDEQARAEPS
jgi:hypothetical protein